MFDASPTLNGTVNRINSKVTKEQLEAMLTTAKRDAEEAKETLAGLQVAVGTVAQNAQDASQRHREELASLKATHDKEISQKQTSEAAEAVSNTCRLWITVAMGCGIPLLSLALSKISGTLATSGLYALSGFAFTLMITVLAVSLPHLAWSVGDITRSRGRASWCLAIALDLSIVLCEFVHTFASEVGLGWVVATVMVTVCLFSMTLNVWAFLKCQDH